MGIREASTNREVPAKELEWICELGAKYAGSIPVIGSTKPQVSQLAGGHSQSSNGVLDRGPTGRQPETVCWTSAKFRSVTCTEVCRPGPSWRRAERG
jgi:hypothetical protein